MIAKVSIINPSIIGEVSSQEQQELNYELLLTTIYKGLDGKSAYQIALEHGFEGTEEEWIASNKLAYKIVTELPKIGDSSIFYLIKNGERYDQYVYDNGSYVFVGDTNVNLDDYYTKNETYSKAETDSKLSDKVDKVNGKRLSTNDYTTEEKSKLANIQEFAEKNVQPNWDDTDQTSDSYIRNKPELFSGDYNDLLNKPNLEEINKSIQEKANVSYVDTLYGNLSGANSQNREMINSLTSEVNEINSKNDSQDSRLGRVETQLGQIKAEQGILSEINASDLRYDYEFFSENPQGFSGYVQLGFEGVSLPVSLKWVKSEDSGIYFEVSGSVVIENNQLTYDLGFYNNTVFIQLTANNTVDLIGYKSDKNVLDKIGGEVKISIDDIKYTNPIFQEDSGVLNNVVLLLEAGESIFSSISWKTADGTKLFLVSAMLELQDGVLVPAQPIIDNDTILLKRNTFVLGVNSEDVVFQPWSYVTDSYLLSKINQGGGGDVDLSGIEQDIADLGGRVDAIENSLGDIETALTTINETLEAL